ncbi:hypothetical protein FDM98_12155 [Microbacterium sp. TL13]|nr:hypothetical protein [Microbacterium sp. TL13]PZT98971.1 MAG: hypothetical protein DI630_17995 [Gordonia sp. (in: high G+C Gram-positive bacteria)]
MGAGVDQLRGNAGARRRGRQGRGRVDGGSGPHRVRHGGERPRRVDSARPRRRGGPERRR